jgi:ribosomal protein L37AE/L43A
MASSVSRPHATAVLLDDEQDNLRSATCPMCHTSATLSRSALDAGGAWRCVRCGQHWDAARLAAVAAYAAWTIEHDAAGRRGTGSSREAVLYGPSPTERPGGRP